MKRKPETVESFNLEAEATVLGTLLVAGERLPDVSDELRGVHFYRAAHQSIYDCMLGLQHRGMRPDLVTVANDLRVAGNLDAVGGPAYLAGLTSGVPRSADIASASRIVRDHAVRRDLYAAAQRMMQAATSAASAEEAVAVSEQDLTSVAAAFAGAGEMQNVNALVGGAVNKIGTVRTSGRAAMGHATGLEDLDARTRGLHPGQLVVIAGRPGWGKTTLALNVARHVSREATVLFFSLEMDGPELGHRLLVAEARQDGHKVLTGPVTDEMWAALGVGEQLLVGSRLLVDDSPYRTVPQIRRITRRVQAQRRDLALVVVDYLQLMTPEKHMESRVREVAALTRGLKLLAKELGIAIIILCQLSRAPEQRTGRQAWPKLSDLRESGDIEQDADQVWFPYKDETADDKPSYIVVAKNRNGPPGRVRVAYFANEYRFANLARVA